MNDFVPESSYRMFIETTLPIHPHFFITKTKWDNYMSRDVKDCIKNAIVNRKEDSNTVIVASKDFKSLRKNDAYAIRGQPIVAPIDFGKLDFIRRPYRPKMVWIRYYRRNNWTYFDPYYLRDLKNFIICGEFLFNDLFIELL